MDERVGAILAGIPEDELARVAGASLGHIGPVQLAGPPAFAEITTPHSDARTIGIVRVTGTASGGPDAPARAWAAVAKVVDLDVEGHFTGATSPRNEVAVYERGLFAGTGSGFRPARCFHISRPGGQVTVLWLEDLTGARGAPFTVDELAVMARHFGSWNAAVAADPPDLGFPVGLDYPARRWEFWDFPGLLHALQELGDDPMVREMYAHHPLDAAADFVSAFGQIAARSRTLPHALSFSDAPIGNFFHRPDETIAVDWSGLGVDPLGGDGGCLIGSALTWGRRFADVAAHERGLFEEYAAGLAEAGCTVDRALIRRGYLAHLGFYLGTIVIFPAMLADPRRMLSRAFFERRFGGPLEDFGAEAQRVIDLLPGYVAEARGLLA